MAKELQPETNNIGAGEQSGIFQTEVDVEEREPPSRIEDEIFLFSETNQRLPKQTQWPIVAEDVAESIGIPEGVMLRRWRRYFQSRTCTAIVTDLFWYCYCEFYDKKKTVHSVSKLKNRVAANYAEMLHNVSIKNGDRDLFLPGLTNAMAQAVFLSFYHSYPRSRVKMDDDFKTNILDTCSSWLSGTRATNPYFQHWQNTLRGGKKTGASHLGASGDQSASGGGNQFSRRKKLVADSMSTRRQPRMKQRTVTFEHTPIMNRFLTHKNGPGFNTMTKVSIRMTENPERPIMSKSKPKQKLKKAAGPNAGALEEEAEETFKDVVMAARKKAQSLMSAHTTAMMHVLNETAADRKELQRQHDDLESKYQAIRETDVHEYSNLLVAKAKVDADHQQKATQHF